MADYFFAPSLEARENLIKEKRDKKKIFMVGNIMIDSLIENLKKINSQNANLKFGLEKKNYFVLTLHRYNNIDVKPVLKEILQAIIAIGRKAKIIFVVHPSTEKKMVLLAPKEHEKIVKAKKIIISGPLGYLEILSLIKNAKAILTDSGGLQEETTFLGVPCLTLRDNTERSVTITSGTNFLAGTAKKSILQAFERLKKAGFRVSKKKPLLWDGKTSQRIIKILKRIV
jgi:UDP-N-acetylglucosamine 2-epimerase (non-hydrolysing)